MKNSRAILASVLALLIMVLQGNAQNGVPLWIKRYGITNNTEFARDLAVDGSGNVFVTGGSHGDTNTVWGHLTLAYSSTGELLWTNRYGLGGGFNDAAEAIAVADTGEVFVTGHSIAVGSQEDYATVAYSSSGVALWTNRYNSPENSADFAFSLAVGGGNVFVTGSDAIFGTQYSTVAYATSGGSLWTNRYRPTPSFETIAYAVAADGGGNAYVTGNPATIKYSSAGAPQWTNRFSGGNGGRAIAVGSNGIVFVTGTSVASFGGADDYVIEAYSSAGTPQWTNRYNGPGNSSDYAQAIAVGSDGKVFVTGYSWGDGNFDYATVAYSGGGVALWTNRYNGSGNGADVATAVAVDHNGNVFVTGYSTGSGSDVSAFDYATLAYSSAGVPLWTNRYNGPGNGEDRANAIAVDASGNVFVTGSSRGLGGYYDADFTTIKYPPTVPPIQMSLPPGPNNPLLLSWPGRFTLQSAATLDGTFTNVSGATSPYTNSLTGSQRFFRLIPD